MSLCDIIRVKRAASCCLGQNEDICPSIKKSMPNPRIWHASVQSKQLNSRVFDASHKYVKFFYKQILSKLCFVLYCKNMHWHNCVKDCYIHDMKIHKKRAISIYPTIVLQANYWFVFPGIQFWNIFFGYCSKECSILKPQLLISLHMGKTYC